QPAFLGPENPSWRGNFKVRYWRREWQEIVLRSLERIVAAGFDGVYLDVIDAFEYFEPGGPQFERQTAPRDMAELGARLAHHLRVELGRTEFLIVPQKGAELLERLAREPARDYLGAIDAIGVEDVFFCGQRPENNAYHPLPELLNVLGRFQAAGK